MTNTYEVAQWHVEQARLHATQDHACGCPLSPEYKKIIVLIHENMSLAV